MLCFSAIFLCHHNEAHECTGSKSINNAKKRGKLQVLIRLCSKVIVRFLTVMMKHGYTGESEITADHRAGKIVVNHMGRLNKYGVISPDLMCNLKI